MKATFTDVPRELFDTIGDAIEKNDNLYAQVYIHYDGSNFRGNLSLESKSETNFLEAIKILVDIYCAIRTR